MKAIQTIALALFVTLFVSSQAHADCFISVQSCKAAGMRAATTFQDSDGTANLLPNRCLQRAREFLNWCKSGDAVNASFYKGGVLLVGVGVTPKGSSLFTVAGGKTQYLQPNY